MSNPHHSSLAALMRCTSTRTRTLRRRNADEDDLLARKRRERIDEYFGPIDHCNASTSSASTQPASHYSVFNSSVLKPNVSSSSNGPNASVNTTKPAEADPPTLHLHKDAQLIAQILLNPSSIHALASKHGQSTSRVLYNLRLFSIGAIKDCPYSLDDVYTHA
ncbi:hypothetical protein HDU78_005547 [Chytriomyces hyalinus]|nr:hypothetical protein HDU78_005547 [Chytriomyces hyalinus]